MPVKPGVSPKVPTTGYRPSSTPAVSGISFEFDGKTKLGMKICGIGQNNNLSTYKSGKENGDAGLGHTLRKPFSCQCHQACPSMDTSG